MEKGRFSKMSITGLERGMFHWESQIKARLAKVGNKSLWEKGGRASKHEGTCVARKKLLEKKETSFLPG